MSRKRVMCAQKREEKPTWKAKTRVPPLSGIYSHSVFCGSCCVQNHSDTHSRARLDLDYDVLSVLSVSVRLTEQFFFLRASLVPPPKKNRTHLELGEYSATCDDEDAKKESSFRMAVTHERAFQPSHTLSSRDRELIIID